MLLFRSEEHVEKWRAERSLPRGAVLTVEQQWRVAQAWYSNRLDRGWRRRPPEEAEELFASFGLTGPFWKLTP